jgi:hypothetical protein
MLFVPYENINVMLQGHALLALNAVTKKKLNFYVMMTVHLHKRDILGQFVYKLVEATKGTARVKAK